MLYSVVVAVFFLVLLVAGAGAVATAATFW